LPASQIDALLTGVFVEDLGRVALWVEGEREERRLVAESLFGSVLLRPAESEDQRWTDAVGAVGVKRSPQERAFALELFGRYLFPVIGSGTVNSGISSPWIGWTGSPGSVPAGRGPSLRHQVAENSGTAGRSGRAGSDAGGGERAEEVAAIHVVT